MDKTKSTARIKPDQHDVNSLGAFIEAAAEVQNEPFFAATHKMPMLEAGPAKGGQFGDRFQFRSALISFQRIWNENEASSFIDICQLLERTGAAGPVLAAAHEEAKNHMNKIWGDLKVTAKEVVDLCLNLVFTNTNIKSTKSSKWHARMDLEKLVKAHGAPLLELVLCTTVHAMGRIYASVLGVARTTLGRWEKEHGLRPQFDVGAPFGRATALAAAAGAMIDDPAMEPPIVETPVEKFERVLSRDSFKALKAILDSLAIDRVVLSETAKKAGSYDQLFKDLGYRVVVAKQIHVNDCYSRVGRAGGIKAVLSCHDSASYSTLVTLVNFDSTLTTTQRSVEFFEKKLGELRTALGA